MKLRQAKKILADRDPDGGARHGRRDDQLSRALRRVQKTASSKESTRYFYQLMDEIGPEGRAYCLRKDMPGEAFRILCEESEGLWFE